MHSIVYCKSWMPENVFIFVAAFSDQVYSHHLCPAIRDVLKLIGENFVRLISFGNNIWWKHISHFFFKKLQSGRMQSIHLIIWCLWKARIAWSKFICHWPSGIVLFLILNSYHLVSHSRGVLKFKLLNKSRCETRLCVIHSTRIWTCYGVPID